MNYYQHIAPYTLSTIKKKYIYMQKKCPQQAFNVHKSI